jgi:S-formylglutathione hydrolase FrmB
MRWKVCWFALLLFCISSAVISAAQSRIDCGAMNSRVLKRAVRYCVYIPEGYDSSGSRRYSLLYYLHGLGDNEQSLFNSGGWTLIDDLRRQNKIGDFLIAAPQGWRSFYINSADDSFRYSDFFLREFMPYIARKYRVVTGRAGRAITGISMGGYGALRFAFADPQLFSAVSAQSAALISETPQELDTAMRSGSPLGNLMAPVFGDPINIRHWDANSPFLLAKKNAAELRTMAIYFNCGQQDNYGFETGGAKLNDELNQEHLPHEYRSYPGDHSIAYFIAHFGEVMEFHSRAFHLTK